jgi:hypothetical protein
MICISNAQTERIKICVLLFNYAHHPTISILAIPGDDKIFKIQYFAEASKYNNYLPIVQKMIDSFGFNNPILKYENPRLGIKMLYPYNWGKAVEMSTVVPSG